MIDDLAKSDFQKCKMISDIQEAFKANERSNHGMVDYLTHLWDKLFTPYTDRLALLQTMS
jgi:hypothetical protein